MDFFTKIKRMRINWPITLLASLMAVLLVIQIISLNGRLLSQNKDRSRRDLYEEEVQYGNRANVESDQDFINTGSNNIHPRNSVNVNSQGDESPLVDSTISKPCPAYNQEVVEKYHNIWMWANKNINSDELYPDSPEVDGVLDALHKAPIVKVDILDLDNFEAGTSGKWILTLAGGQKAVFKPLMEKMGEPKAHGYCNYGYEMPSSEIAAWRLLRLLDIRNAPYAVGRKVNLRTEIIPAATPKFMRKLVIKEDHLCYRDKCRYCDKDTVACPAGDLLPGSVVYWLPRKLHMHTKPPDYTPWSTIQRDRIWGSIGFNNKTFCNMIPKIPPYGNPEYFRDLFDFAVFDYLTYHYDTKHYTIADHSEAHGLTVRLDHGRTFCVHRKDEDQVFLAPIYQCCTIRRKLFEKLQEFKENKLSDALRDALKEDPLYPILVEQHYQAIDRRYNKIMDTFDKCAQAQKGYASILL
ncbi:unnamed protein product [Owenia fusiformis]|uniref:Uncharacterized protein n=1 Tax=Owenia fusiformis TaxID=6347 RepID=A0A8J1TAU4_OWEFU|nr:unnamed protein product [Owenia fusiformis]